jgi:HprK-related kinase A
VRLRDRNPADVEQAIADGGLLVKLGPFIARIKTDVAALVVEFQAIYADFQVVAPDQFADFHVEVCHERGIRRWIKPEVRFFFDGRPSFTPLPSSQAFAMLEWGLNWCVAAHCHQYLVIHAAVIERNGRAALLPAPPGSGKSTLCAGLVLRGWRLLSDELALYDIATGLVYGMARPINLKNRSIEVIKQFTPDAQMTAPMHGTTKGTVALLRPPQTSVERAHEPVQPTWIILPKYVGGAAPLLELHSRARTFMLLAEQSFNYDLQGAKGFNALGKLVDHCECYQFVYSLLDDAERVFDALANGALA